MQSKVLTIASINIRQDASGRYSLNDLHRAAGGEKRHQPANWLRAEQTQGLIEELRKYLNLSVPHARGTDTINDLEPVVTTQGFGEQGTYAVKELVYAYAMWISPAFNLKVIRAYDAMATGVQVYQPLNPANLSRLQLIEIAMQAEQERLVLEHQVAEIAPKAAALDRLSTSDGALCLTNTAKSLQVRPKDLFAWLSAHRWVYRRPGGSGWTAYQDRIQQGYLEHKVTVVTREDGSEKTVEQVRVTPKGLARLASAFNVSVVEEVSA